MRKDIKRLIPLTGIAFGLIAWIATIGDTFRGAIYYGFILIVFLLFATRRFK